MDDGTRTDPSEVEPPRAESTTRALPGLLAKLDDFQQDHAFAALPFAVYKKFSDDEAGKLAALISYYAFISVFPC